MAALTPAQEEFNAILDKQSRGAPRTAHPEDSRHNHDEDSEQDEEAEFQQERVDREMAYDGSALPGSGGGSSRLNLPPPDFDQGRTTGVKGVIADARSFESARSGHRSSKSTSQGGSAGQNRLNASAGEEKEMLRDHDDEEDELEDDEEFLEQWREERKRELEAQVGREGNDIRNRRTAPSSRRYGRFDEVDALGYLDAIEKVGKETVVCVFVYDVDVSYPPSKYKTSRGNERENVANLVDSAQLVRSLRWR